MREWKGYSHGIDLGGWLSQCDHTKERYENFIVKDDIKRISEWGLDHVRLPVDYEVADGAPEYIDRCLEWCREYGLNMVLDLHKTYGYSFDEGEGECGFFESEEYQEKFYGIWEKLSERYKDVKEGLAFELLNEVTKKEYSDAWNRILTECIKRIRKTLPEIKIITGGYYNNSIEALEDLAMPYDENIIYTFHCYEPLIFTHQGAYWISTMDRAFRIPVDASYAQLEEASGKNLPYVVEGFEGFDPDKSLGEEYFERLFAKAVRVAEERNVPLYCGEYGVIDLAAPEECLKWYSLISSVFNKYNIGRAAWSYKEMDFGFIGERMEPYLKELVSLL
ncbi:MAG: cellulase family glycosylhydrolase [Lachnospiraceae bacterium]|nr:cellulase family glycosylhydrolase [Lachnospiraceae bacterium]